MISLRRCRRRNDRLAESPARSHRGRKIGFSSWFGSPAGEAEGKGKVVGLRALAEREAGEFLLERFDIATGSGDFEFSAFGHDLHFRDEAGAGNVAGRCMFAGRDGDADDVAVEFFAHHFDDGNAGAGFVDDYDTDAAFLDAGDHSFEFPDDFVIRHAERDAFGLANDVAGLNSPCLNPPVLDRRQNKRLTLR